MDREEIPPGCFEWFTSDSRRFGWGVVTRRTPRSVETRSLPGRHRVRARY